MPLLAPQSHLDRLPHASSLYLASAPWEPVTTRTFAEAIDADPQLLATWRLRRIFPESLPHTWFTRLGRTNVYRASTLLAWLHGRRGEDVSEVELWATHLRDGLGLDGDPRQLAHTLAKAAGPVVGGIRFTSTGWEAYLTSLLR